MAYYWQKFHTFRFSFNEGAGFSEKNSNLWRWILTQFQLHSYMCSRGWKFVDCRWPLDRWILLQSGHATRHWEVCTKLWCVGTVVQFLMPGYTLRPQRYPVLLEHVCSTNFCSWLYALWLNVQNSAQPFKKETRCLCPHRTCLNSLLALGYGLSITAL